MNVANYRDFYQKALIPIGLNDLYHFKEISGNNHLIPTHWLIALEGQLKDIENEFYTWIVSIYPSDSNGSFSWNASCYTSSIYHCIHQAYEHANELERTGKNGQLFTSKNKEDVS
ncbi:hypothetical protein [Cytobacillus massiliigabonensis]|uniref:hypothetical protein n=1 Tax=Cytobacillus massiliigabonensis TaxID=1871011 RepID=UPI000C83939C|nr:hypothetical protein [Cytobacillus massiliigabonensis]